MYLFGLIKGPLKVATDYVYQSVCWDIYTREEVIYSFSKEEFDKKFELDSDGTIYFKPHVEIVIKDSGYNEFKYFNSNQELLDWIDSELEKEDLKLKTKWINI